MKYNGGSKLQLYMLQGSLASKFNEYTHGRRGQRWELYGAENGPSKVAKHLSALRWQAAIEAAIHVGYVYWLHHFLVEGPNHQI